MFYVYVLNSQVDGTLYVGLASDVDRRLRQHNGGQGRSTKAKRPFTLLLAECFPTREAARAREQYYNSGFGREVLKASFGPPVPGWRNR